MLTSHHPSPQEGRHKDLSEGHYHVHKGEVHIEVRTHYSIINFSLELQVGLGLGLGLRLGDGRRFGGSADGLTNHQFKTKRQDGARGKFSQLYMKEHTSLAYKDPSGTPVPHTPAHDNFKFYGCMF